MRTKKIRRRDPNNLSYIQIQHLIGGWCISTPVPWHDKLSFPFKDEAHRRELYFENRDFILSLQGNTTGGLWHSFEYGKRPDAWWDYESTGMRRILSIPEHGLDDRSTETFRGMWNCQTGETYETEFQYLKRNNLLWPGEAEAYEKQEKEKTIKAHVRAAQSPSSTY